MREHTGNSTRMWYYSLSHAVRDKFLLWDVCTPLVSLGKSHGRCHLFVNDRSVDNWTTGMVLSCPLSASALLETR